MRGREPAGDRCRGKPHAQPPRPGAGTNEAVAAALPSLGPLASSHVTEESLDPASCSEGQKWYLRGSPGHVRAGPAPARPAPNWACHTPTLLPLQRGDCSWPGRSACLCGSGLTSESGAHRCHHVGAPSIPQSEFQKGCPAIYSPVRVSSEQSQEGNEPSKTCSKRLPLQTAHPPRS